jgi:ureidoacrylate peracid hydrolase
MIDRGRCALLVVDMEHDFVHGPMAVVGAAALASRLAALVSAARSAGVPVVFASQQLRAGGDDIGPLERFEPVRSGAALREGAEGVRVVAELDPRPTDLYVVKRRFSTFFGTDLDLLLRSRGVQQLLVCGVAAHVCCDTTARDAFQLGYETFYVVDGVEMGDLPDLGFGPVAAEDAKRVVATVLAHRFATLRTIDEVIAELR